MENIHLKGGSCHLTENAQTAYRVSSGQVLVFIIPVKEGTPERRYFLYEAAPGEVLPSLSCEAPYRLDKDENCMWHLGFVALEEAQLQLLPGESTPALQEEWAARIALRNSDLLGFEEALIETYQLNIVKELRDNYTVAEEQKSTYQKGLQIIYKLFQKGAAEDYEPSGHALYDAVSYLCHHQKINIHTLESIRAGAGRNFGLEDIARISHFISREIILEGAWYRKDCGPILAYHAKTGQPVACIPKGPSHYMLYIPGCEEYRPLTESYAEQLRPQAVMLYRPLPNAALKIKDLLRYAAQDVRPRDIITLFGMALVGTLIGLLLPYINEQLYDSFIPMSNRIGLVQVCCVILACTVGNICFTIIKNLSTLRLGSDIKYGIQSALYDRLFNLPESFFRKYDSVDLAMRGMSISTIGQAVIGMVTGVGLSGLLSLLYLWRMYKYSAKLANTSLIMLLCSGALIVFLGWRQTRHEARLLETDSKANSLMYQLLLGISKVRIAGVEDRALYEYLKPYTAARRIYMIKERLAIVSNIFVQSINTVFSIVLFYIMITGNISLSIGAFMGFTAAFGSFSGAVLAVVSSLMQVNDVIPLYKRLNPLLETLPEVEDDTELPGEITGEIEISNVSFSYDEDGPLVLNDLCLHIQPGEYVGLVGSSGCGKSTLLKLLLGFEKPTQGKIFYDGRDIDGMDKRELRKKMGVVLQDGRLIGGSIFENITITASQTPMERVKQVVKDVGLEDDIAQMPMGLHTVLSEDSGTISGGQQQRILIARAIVGKPKILMFDEATSALDNVTQAMVCESLERLKATRIVIAHRLSTVIHCDRILVLDHGTLAESGTYDELMAQKGLFYSLASRQIG